MNATDQQHLKEYREDANGGVENDVKLVEFDENGRVKDSKEFQAIAGLAKITLSPDDQVILQKLCSGIETIAKDKMVAWAGSGGSDTTRLRAMAFPSQARLDALHEAGVDIYNPDKEGMEADVDRAANKKACVILNEEIWNDQAKGAVERLIACLKNALPEHADTLSMEELVAVQPNLHNGAPFLKAHLDKPLHDGFGKVIVTAAVSGSATVLLYGPVNKKTKNHEGVWRFPLEQGQVYCLSGLARTNCLHGVYAGDDTNRKSLNLRFGLHTKEEIDKQTWWKDADGQE